jgi:hypothetical protein
MLFLISGSKELKILLRHPKFQHLVLLMSFFMRCVLLLSMDIVTDISTAANFLSSDHYHWGMCTVVPIFAPFAVRIVMNLLNLCRCFKLTIINNSSVQRKYRLNQARLSFCIQEIKQLIWHFPMLQPIR